MSYNPTAITPLAQGYVPFAGAKPTKHLWVSPTGNDNNSGSSSAPFKTISAAMAKADPGTAVMVKAGSYTDSIRVKSGTTDKPVWLVSADGEGAAKITASSPDKPVVYGFGNDNIVIKGLEIIGGVEGIKFTQSGSYLKNLTYNIVLQDNLIRGQHVDGIKISQGVNHVVVNNTVSNVTGEEGIDAVYLRHTLIAHNDVSNITGNGGIVVKAASDGVKIHNNHVQDIIGNGISLGGHSTGQGASWPNGVAYEARNIDVKGNLVEDVSKHALITKAAHNSTISKNSFESNTSYYTVVATDKDNHGWDSKNIQFTDNVVQRDKWLADHSEAVKISIGNVETGSFSESKVGSGVLGVMAEAADGGIELLGVQADDGLSFG
jgi:Right handed beta helix region